MIIELCKKMKIDSGSKVNHVFKQERNDCTMSFASEMKNELTRIDVDEMNAKAELSALIRMNGALSLSNQQFVINVQTENATTARRIYSLIKRVFNVEVEILVRKKMKLKK